MVSLSRTVRNSLINLSPSPSLRLSYQAAISITSLFTSGLATTCHFCVSFAIGDLPSGRLKITRRWDSNDGLPNVLPRESHLPPTMEDHPIRSRGVTEAAVLRT